MSGGFDFIYPGLQPGELKEALAAQEKERAASVNAINMATSVAERGYRDDEK